MGKVEHQLLLTPAAWLPCAPDRRLASASVSSKAIIAILSKTRPIARMVLLPVRLFVRPMLLGDQVTPRKQLGLQNHYSAAAEKIFAQKFQPSIAHELRACEPSSRGATCMPRTRPRAAASGATPATSFAEKRVSLHHPIGDREHARRGQ